MFGFTKFGFSFMAASFLSAAVVQREILLERRSARGRLRKGKNQRLQMKLQRI